MSSITVGLIGAGMIAERHVKGITRENDILGIKAVCDIEPARAEAIADRYSIRDRCSDYRELLDNDEIEAVVVLAPHHLHEEICIRAAERGKHILVEKPIARTLDEADRIIEAARKADVILMVGLNQRYLPAHRKIKDLLKDGAVGRVLAANADHWEDFLPAGSSWWRSKNSVGGGCLIGSGVHRLDLLRWYIGNPKEISAYETYDESRFEGEVAAVAIVRFENGAIANYLCSWGVRGPWPHGESLSITGTKGGVCWKDGTYFLTDTTDPRNEQTPLVVSEGEYESMWRHFGECIRSGDVPLTSGEEGRKSLEIVMAAYSSMRSGMSVTL